MNNYTSSFGNLAKVETADESTIAQAPAGDLSNIEAMLKQVLQQTAPTAAKPKRNALQRVELMRLFTGWQRDCVISQHSRRTLGNYERTFNLLVWFLDHKGHKSVGTEELREFLAYASTATLTIAATSDAAGAQRSRWGYTAKERPMAVGAPEPGTIVTYHGHLRAFFNWIVAQGELDESPLKVIKLPKNRRDQVQPFSKEQCRAIVKAAQRSSNPLRDEAICRFLLSTGTRAEELCSLKIGDIDTAMKTARISGKGDKERSVGFGKKTARALWNYRNSPRKATAPADAQFFTSERGDSWGEPLTPNGLHQMIVRLRDDAGVTGVRCSPHTFRHTFAIEYLKKGNDAFSLQQALGHESPDMTAKYVNYARADIEIKMIKSDPADDI